MIPILGAHGLLLAIIALASPPPVRQAQAGTLMVFDVSGPPRPAAAATARAQAVEPPVHSKNPMHVPDPPVIEAAAPVLLLVSAPPAPAAGGQKGLPCDLDGAVAQSLVGDENVHQAVVAVPRAERSVANAIMLWDGRWTDDARLRAIRVRVSGVIAAASDVCRDEAQAGPRLVAVAMDGETVMLALGSGRWRWADLLQEPPPVGGMMTVALAAS